MPSPSNDPGSNLINGAMAQMVYGHLGRNHAWPHVTFGWLVLFANFPLLFSPARARNRRSEKNFPSIVFATLSRQKTGMGTFPYLFPRRARAQQAIPEKLPLNHFGHTVPIVYGLEREVSLRKN